MLQGLLKHVGSTLLSDVLCTAVSIPIFVTYGASEKLTSVTDVHHDDIQNLLFSCELLLAWLAQ